MRLIDADALIDDLMDRYCKECYKRRGIKNGKYRIIYEIGEAPCRACDVDDAKAELEEAPTIDPVKHGRLIDGIVSFHWTCSECGCHLRKDLGQVFERETDRYNYCPNCGAKMDGGEG